MSVEAENTEGTTEVVAPVETKTVEELNDLNEKLYTEVKGLRGESKERRLKLEAYEKADKEKADSELSYKERFETLDGEFTNYKANQAQATLNNEFTSQMVELGLPSKIAKIAVPTDLTPDSMKDAIKSATKEFAEFIKVDDGKTDKPTSPYQSAQPKTKADKQPQQSVGQMAREAAKGNQL